MSIDGYLGYEYQWKASLGFHVASDTFKFSQVN